MFLAMNRFKVLAGSEDAFEEVWRNRRSRLDEMPGFVSFDLMRGPDGETHTLFASHTIWKDEAAFRAWTRWRDVLRQTRRRAPAAGQRGGMSDERGDPQGALGAALGPLSALLDDPRTSDVLVNGTGTVWVDRGQGVQPAGVSLADARSARRLAVRLAALSGQRLDESCPFVDGLLPGGVRLHALLPPLVEDGPHISLRIPRRRVPDLPDLQRWGMVDDLGAQVLRAVVASRSSFLVTGGTGSGKTTLLAAMLGLVQDRERIVVVEDVRELRVDHPHVVHLQGRANNVEGRGEVTLTTLVRQSLRMRPDRVVVGEVRGAEVRELLTALNTGHEGGAGTLHANAARDVLSRFEALGALAEMSPAAVHAQLASAMVPTRSAVVSMTAMSALTATRARRGESTGKT